MCSTGDDLSLLSTKYMLVFLKSSWGTKRVNAMSGSRACVVFFFYDLMKNMLNSIPRWLIIVSISHLLKRNKHSTPFLNWLQLNSFIGEMGEGSFYSTGINAPRCVSVISQELNSILGDTFFCASIYYLALNFK